MSQLCPLPLLCQAARGAMLLCQSHPDAALRSLGQVLERALSRLERPVIAAAQQEERLRDRLLALQERSGQLHLRLLSDARLQHAEPRRAEAAKQVLRALPPPAMVADPLLGPLAAERCLGLLSEAQALLQASAEPATAERLSRLALTEVIAAIAALREDAAAQAARWVAAREALAEHDDQPTLPLEEEATVELLLRYRAYARAATGPLHPDGEQPIERARLLAPLRVLPLADLSRSLGQPGDAPEPQDPPVP